MLHDCIANLYERNKTFKSDSDCEYYLIRMMYLSINSPTSPFYIKEILYQKNRRDLSSSFDQQKEVYVFDKLVSENLDQLIKRLPYFERAVFEEYIFSNFSYDKLAKDTGIPKVYLYRTVKEVKRKLQSYGDFCTDISI